MCGAQLFHARQKVPCESEPARESGLPADQSLTEYTRSNCGSEPARESGLPVDQSLTECTRSNCGSEPARESGLTVDQSLTECTRSNCGSWLASDGVLANHINITGKTFGHCLHLNVTRANLFKIHEPLRHNGYNALRRYLRLRQNPPAYTTIARAISFPCHCPSVAGFSSPHGISKCMSPIKSGVSMPALRWWLCAGRSRARRPC